MTVLEKQHLQWVLTQVKELTEEPGSLEGKVWSSWEGRDEGSRGTERTILQ